MTAPSKGGRRFVCVHAHYYQPPRENPWTETIEVQDSAYPFHDWNEKITAECYAANGWARLLDEMGRIRRITNNYSLVSFNAGPTLLSWLEANDPGTYERILEGDRESVRARRGHGNALAQAYNHMILPLAGRRDKATQVRWGIADFVRRFGRAPEGMWLPETAVDTETLEVLAENGIRFTVLAPGQAAGIRPLSRERAGAERQPPSGKEGREGKDGRDKAAPGEGWQDAGEGRIDPSRAYRFRLPAGRSIDLFFYDGPISHAVAFGGILASGEAFAQKILGGFAPERTWPQLVHLATDGESYGHHHRFGEMALAYALDRIESTGEAMLTNYGLFLEENPPTHEVRLVEPSSWSCAHGVERWRSDCGCNMGTRPQWNQKWRSALRGALDWLRDAVDPFFEREGSAVFTDVWTARERYIACVLDRTPENVDSWLAREARPSLDPSRKLKALSLLEMERQRMLAYTSCAWFFDDISGIETVQCLRHAARSLQLARELGFDLEAEFLLRLAFARSNLPEMGDGAGVYEKLVKPSITDLSRVLAHHALTASVGAGEPAPVRRIYCYQIRQEDWSKESYGESSLTVGRAEARSEVTGAALRACFGVLHYGGHDFHCSLAPEPDEEGGERVKRELLDSFGSHSLTEVVRALDRNLGTRYYELIDLFLEERREVIGRIVREDLKRLEGTYRTLFRENRRLMEYLRETDVPLPKGFLVSAEYVLARDLEAAVERLARGGAIEPVREIATEAKKWSLDLDRVRVERTLGRAIEERIERLFDPAGSPGSATELAEIDALTEAAEITGARLDLWRVQNLYHASLPLLRSAGGLPPEIALLGEKLGFGAEILGAWKAG